MEEIRTTFHHELGLLQSEIVRLGSMVSDVVPLATEALLGADLGLAQEVIDGDDELDDLTMRIEEHCYSTLALQNPVSSDLRAVITAAWISSELERSGDLAVNICKATRRVFGATLDRKLSRLISEMSTEATRLLRLAIGAYVEKDASLAAALDDMDDRLDELHADYIGMIFETLQSTDEIQPAVQLALIGRYYERIGDHAVNIGERVQYMVTGTLSGRLVSDDEKGGPSSAGIVVGGVEVDPGRHEVRVDGVAVTMPLKEFELLTLLADNAGRVLTREVLIDRIWGADYVGDTKTLDVHVKRLRSKLEVDPRNPKRIVTIRGLGYKFVKP